MGYTGDMSYELYISEVRRGEQGMWMSGASLDAQQRHGCHALHMQVLEHWDVASGI